MAQSARSWRSREIARDKIRYVWTGGVLQEKNLETAALGLAPMYPAYLWSN